MCIKIHLFDPCLNIKDVILFVPRRKLLGAERGRLENYVSEKADTRDASERDKGLGKLGLHFLWV